MERKLSVGDTLSEVFRIYRDQAGVLLPIAFWLYLLVVGFERLAADSVGLTLIAIVLTLVATFLYQGIVVRLVEDVRDGRRDSSAGDLARAVLPVLPRLIGAGLLAALGIAGGFILLVVPGLYLLTIWAVTSPVVVIERRRVFDAFGRSRQLVKDNGWPTLGATLVAFLIGTIVAVLLNQLANELADDEIFRVVLDVLAQTVTAPIEGLLAAVIYFRLLEIKGTQPQAAPPSVPQQPGDSLG